MAGLSDQACWNSYDRFWMLVWDVDWIDALYTSQLKQDG
jgi:hypothetical protein